MAELVGHYSNNLHHIKPPGFLRELRGKASGRTPDEDAPKTKIRNVERRLGERGERNIVELFLGGHSAREIACVCDMSYYGVRLILIKHGFKGLGVPPITDEVREELIRLYVDERLSFKRISSRMGIYEGRVRRALTQAGVQVRGRYER